VFPEEHRLEPNKHVPPTPAQRELHDYLIAQRNQYVAHSDLSAKKAELGYFKGASAQRPWFPMGFTTEDYHGLMRRYPEVRALVAAVEASVNAEIERTEPALAVVIEARRRRATAFHEAAHAVVAYRLDINIGEVSIRPDLVNNEAGSCAIAEWRGLPNRDNHVVYLFAGLEGTRLFIDPGARSEDGASYDYELAATLHGQDQPPQHLMQRARDMVHQNRAAIEALAEALIEHTTLHGDSATIVVDCVDEGEDWRPVLSAYWKQWGLGEGGKPADG